MKYCRFCGAELEDDSLFCNKCGQKVEVTEQPVVEEKQPMVESQPVVELVPVKPKRVKPTFHPTAIIGFAFAIMALIAAAINLINLLCFSNLFTTSGDTIRSTFTVSSICSVISDVSMIAGLVLSIVGVVLSRNKVFGIVGIVSAALSFIISAIAMFYVIFAIGVTIASGFFGIFYYFLYAIVMIFSIGFSVG